MPCQGPRPGVAAALGGAAAQGFWAFLGGPLGGLGCPAECQSRPCEARLPPSLRHEDPALPVTLWNRSKRRGGAGGV